MKAEERRELVLEAATAVFGDYGYVGATTDQVAKAAGVSQPYVVRMFGTKEQLFVEVLRRALDRLLAVFRQALATYREDAGGRELGHYLGRAYVELVTDRGILLSLMHAFVLGGEPAIGRVARAGFLEVYAFLRDEAGFEPERVREFLAGGMLINTLVGVRMATEYDTNPAARELLETTVPEKLDLLLDLGHAQRAGADE
jgi:AcrR family transcriptional regulator